MNEVLVERASAANCCLVREGAGSFQAALNRHQSELEREIVWVDRAETEQATLFEKEQSMRAQLSERRRARLAIQQKRHEVLAGRAHARVLVIYNPETLLIIDH